MNSLQPPCLNYKPVFVWLWPQALKVTFALNTSVTVSQLNWQVGGVCPALPASYWLLQCKLHALWKGFGNLIGPQHVSHFRWRHYEVRYKAHTCELLVLWKFIRISQINWRMDLKKKNEISFFFTLWTRWRGSVLLE